MTVSSKMEEVIDEKKNIEEETGIFCKRQKNKFALATLISSSFWRFFSLFFLPALPSLLLFGF
jgi:hypothetical protein